MTVPVYQGPPYPDLGANVAKWRRVAAKAGSIAAMARADRRAYAEAIFKAIRAKHRAMHMRATPSPSAGWHTPPAISRLFKYDRPLPMRGDPAWTPKDGGCPWAARERAVYAAAMEAKRALQINVAA
jgi:hypothetical protein